MPYLRFFGWSYTVDIITLGLCRVKPKLHHSDFPVTSPRVHETGKLPTCRGLIGRFHVPAGKSRGS